MAGTKLIFILPLLLIVAASMQAEALQCYQCVDCEDYEEYEQTLTTCPPPEPAITAAPETRTKPKAAQETTASSETSAEPTEAPETTVNPTAAPETSATPTEAPETQANLTEGVQTTEKSMAAQETSAATEPPVKQARRRRATEPELTSPQCAKITYKVGDATKIKRQCSFKNKSVDGQTRCENLSKNLEGSTCVFCDKDKCNSATKFAVASLTIVMGLIILTF